MPCWIIKWHFSQFKVRFFSLHRARTRLRWWRHSEKESPKMKKSSMKTSRIFPPCQKKYWAYIVGMLQVHCTTQRACVCMQMFQRDMWMWFSPDPQELSGSDYNRSIHQGSNNIHFWLDVPTSGQWTTKENGPFLFSLWAFCNRYTLAILCRIGISSSLSFLTTVVPDFFGTTCTGSPTNCQRLDKLFHCQGISKYLFYCLLHYRIHFALGVFSWFGIFS